MTSREQRPSLKWVQQPCASCKEAHRVLRSERSWRTLCAPCYAARKKAAERAEREAALVTCKGCEVRVPRGLDLLGLCAACYAEDLIAEIQRRSRGRHMEGT